MQPDMQERLRRMRQDPSERSEPPARKQRVPDGVYKVGDAIYKVRTSREGHAFATIMVMHYDHKGEPLKGVFEYAPGDIKRISIEDALTMEEAAAFGIRTVVCCVCGTKLENEDSIARGIGPVCLVKMGWA